MKKYVTLLTVTLFLGAVAAHAEPGPNTKTNDKVNCKDLMTQTGIAPKVAPNGAAVDTAKDPNGTTAQ